MTLQLHQLSTQLKPDGTIGSWATLSTMPAVMYAHSAVAANGYLFVTGGYTGAAAVSTVYSAPINSDGTVGTWATLSTIPATRFRHSTVAYNGYLFVIGGQTVSTVYSAPINSNGTIGAWATLSTLPVTLRYHSAVAYNGYLFAIAGYNDAPSSASTVYSAPIKSYGTIGSWNTLLRRKFS